MGFSIFSDYGILGINARNLQYIRPFNSKKAKYFADSKLKTKQYLSARGIPVPKLIATIRTRKDLAKMDFSTLPDNFVIKPNAGYGGEGIIVIAKKLREGVWETVSGKTITEEDLLENIEDILDGRYSLASLPDIALIETRLISAELIPNLVMQGLPDIRIVMFKLIPMLAMLRIPTPLSEGKANVHLGGIGIGVDIVTGKTTSATQYNKIIKELPGGIPTAGHQIPHWEKILRIASEAQLHANLGFLAVDIVMDENAGPVLIEVNARSGLMVQIANRIPLKARLERVRGLKVESPEKGIQLSKQLFGKDSKKKKQKRKVVGFASPGEILSNGETHRITAELNPTQTNTSIDKDLAKKLKLAKVGESKNKVHLKLLLAETRITTVAELADLSKADYKVILGRKDLGGFLIDPTLQESKILPKGNGNSLVKKADYTSLDKQLMEIDKKIKLLYHLKPINLAAEKRKFFASKKSNPHFRYPALRFDVEAALRDLEKITFPNTPLGEIFRAKKTEIQNKLNLLLNIGKPEFTEFSRKLYGFPSEEIVSAAREILAQKPASFTSEKISLPAQAAAEVLQKILLSYGLKQWKISLKENLASDALAGKSNSLFLRKAALFSPQHLQALAAHEIETHILRAENGKSQPYQIFSRGLANYLETEEGLAIYNQSRFLKEGNEKQFWMVIGLLSVEFAATHSFREVFDFTQQQGFSRERSWKTALKVKRGLIDTRAAGCFTKEQVYFSGLQKIEKFLAEGGDLRDLYLGKIKIEDIPFMKNFSEIKPAKLLPEFLEK